MDVWASVMGRLKRAGLTLPAQRGDPSRFPENPSSHALLHRGPHHRPLFRAWAGHGRQLFRRQPAADRRVVRRALVLEDIEVMAERLGARVLSDDEASRVTAAEFDPGEVLNLRFFHALLGNWDYSLATGGRGVWNTDVLEFPTGGMKLPVAGDFDLASWVTGTVRGSAPREYHPELGEVERETLYQLEEIRASVTKQAFEAARDRFLGGRSAVESGIASAEIDVAGRANAGRHALAFYEALLSMRNPQEKRRSRGGERRR